MLQLHVLLQLQCFTTPFRGSETQISRLTSSKVNHQMYIPDQTLDYKSRLANLDLLPLMYFYELQDLLFFIKCLLDPDDTMNIHTFVSFSGSSCSSRSCKLSYNLCHTSTYRHFYFNRLVRLWNSIPADIIDLSSSFAQIKKALTSFFWNHFTTHFNPANLCSFHVVCPCVNCSKNFI